MYAKTILAIATFVTLSACGGSSDSTIAEVIEPVTSIPELNAMSVPLGALTQPEGVSFERHLKNGIYLRHQSDIRITFSDGIESPEQSSAPASYSSTVVQEQGVDESDRIKYDGQYMFIATQEDSFSIEEGEEKKAQTGIRIMERASNGSLSEMSQITVNEQATYINGIYLKDKVLAVLSDFYNFHTMAATSFAEDFFPVQQNFNVSFVSVVNPLIPEKTASLTVDGAIIDSRRVGDVLYVVSSYSASIDDIQYVSTPEEQLINYNKILATDINDLLPKYSDANGAEHNLVTADNCFLPEEATELDGFDGIVTLTAIDLNDPTNLTSVCVNSQVQGLYASPQSIYLYGTEYQYQDNRSTETSVIHKFSVNEQQINYQASGTLAGRFNWDLSNLRFSEQGDYLRVVTTTGNGGDGYQHKLNVLMEDANKLMVVSQLPNDSNPQLIGKQSDDGKVYEDIKSVRYYQKQAYIVTFQNTDPLYVIDLKDNLSPNITGELEIPGYSAYLQPLSDDLLLGIGQNVDPLRAPGEESSPIIEGAKVSLFDISDITSPKEIHSIVYEHAYTPVEYDYHALTMLSMENTSFRFSIPLEKWITETLVDEQQKYDVWYRENSLALFEVTGNTKDASLVEVGKMKVEDLNGNTDNYNARDDRAIFHDNDVYYLHGNKIWQSLWTLPELVSGPY
jgi:uncharacterized secreted protein with C-terminal beta-propeller domain